jgi:hypothetical protein
LPAVASDQADHHRPQQQQLRAIGEGLMKDFANRRTGFEAQLHLPMLRHPPLATRHARGLLFAASELASTTARMMAGDSIKAMAAAMCPP